MAAGMSHGDQQHAKDIRNSEMAVLDVLVVGGIEQDQR